MKKKSKDLFVFSRRNYIPLVIGAGLIVLYLIIFQMLQFKGLSFNYDLLFTRLNINNVPIIVVGIVHTLFLAFGILMMFYYFIKMGPKVICKNDRVIITHPLQAPKEVSYDKIKVHQGKLFLSKTDLLFVSRMKKEFRIVFENPVYSFYLFYEVEGFQDGITEFKEKEIDFNERRVYGSRGEIEKFLGFLAKNYYIKAPFLPKEKRPQAILEL